MNPFHTNLLKLMVEAIDNVIVMAKESVFAKCKVFFICHFLPSGNSDYALKLY